MRTSREKTRTSIKKTHTSRGKMRTLLFAFLLPKTLFANTNFAQSSYIRVISFEWEDGRRELEFLSYQPRRDALGMVNSDTASTYCLYRLMWYRSAQGYTG